MDDSGLIAIFSVFGGVIGFFLIHMLMYYIIEKCRASKTKVRHITV